MTVSAYRYPGRLPSCQLNAGSTTRLLGTCPEESRVLRASGLVTSWPSTSGPNETVPLTARAWGSRSSFAGFQGPLTRYPYAWPGPTPGTNACQMSASLSRSEICVSAPDLSNRHKVTLSATLEAIEKFVPTLPRRLPGVGPSGWILPGSATAALVSGLALASGAGRAAGTSPTAVAA